MMRRVPLGQLRPGMILGRSIYGETGEVLLRQGVKLSSRYIEALRVRGYQAAYIFDGNADDLGPQEIVSDSVRVAARKHMNDLFDLVRGGNPAPTPSSLEVTRPPLAAAAPLVAQICQDVENIIKDVLNTEVVDGVISLKSHDNYSFEHSVEVMVVGVLLGKRLHLPPDALRQLALGGMLHDIGKLVIPKEILNKPGHLSAEEWALVEQHPQTGYDIVKALVPTEDSLLARHVVWQHHERQDGQGYPRRLGGNNTLLRSANGRFLPGQILLVAEIAAVADVYSALASDRPYRQAMEPTQILSSLQQMAGSHLNREIVKRFLSILPVYPVGSEVVIIGGERHGCRALVVSVNAAAIDRPTIRVILDPRGARIAPFEIDLRKDEDVQIATPNRVLQMAS